MNNSNTSSIPTAAETLPDKGRVGTWVGRVWAPAAHAIDGIAGPRVAVLRDGALHETPFATMSALVNSEDPVAAVQNPGPPLGDFEAIVAASFHGARAARLVDEQATVLLAPNDLLATRACGVTFVRSLLERVVEEKARGAPEEAREIRRVIMEILGADLSGVVPGSPAAAILKEKLTAAGVWSQYLEVGIGKDAEIFTKAQPMATVGFGARIGVLPSSTWNNPEPEVVLAVSRRGEIRGAALGNDVNLRDYEGRSALLLGEAKDQNGSCAIGPMIRLFDSSFTLADITRLEIELTVTGADGFRSAGHNHMSRISRSPEQLVRQAIGPHHQYPDGLMLFLGTMFAPTEDRDADGQGFTHHLDDRVEIAAAPLGRLVNWVGHTDRIPRWEYGVGELLEYLLQRDRHRRP